MDNSLEKEIIEILFDKNAPIQVYKYDILTVAMENKKYDCIEFLLKKYTNSRSLLGTKTYYSDEKIVELFTENLLKKEPKDQQYAKHYKAMFLYGTGQFQKALELFEEVNDQDLALVAIFHKGLCAEYLHDLENAKKYFNEVQKSKIPYYDATNIKNIAIAHLNSISPFNQEENNLTNWLKEYSKEQNPLLRNTNFLSEMNKFTNFVSSNKNTQFEKSSKYEHLKQKLVEVKYIQLKKYISEKVILAYEFQDIPEMKDHFYNSIEENQKINFDHYVNAIQTVDKSTDLVGEIINYYGIKE